VSQRNVGNYEILKKLGEGGMGVVYQARDKALDRLVALKFLRAETAGDLERRRFTREAMAASALDHPNICTIYQIGTADDGQLFIAMAYYEGDTVGQLVSAGPLAIEQAVDICAQAADGLAKAHAG
jgi:serine/threonine-protein kinase